MHLPVPTVTPVRMESQSGYTGTLMHIAGDVSSAATGGMSRFYARRARPRPLKRESGMRSWMAWTRKRTVKQLTIIETEKGFSRSLILLIDRGARNGYPEVVADPP